jgi:AraC-like DNA-binding protein
VNGETKPFKLSAGDFVVLTRGDAHVMRSARSTPATDLFDLAKCNAPDKDKVFRAGGDGPVTKMVCGAMRFEHRATDPLLAVLPPLLYGRATGGGARPWLRSTLEHVAAELDSGGAGSEEVVTRLADIFFIQAVRAYFEENADTVEFGWLAAVRDQQIGRALALLHGHPEQPWTVASIARRLTVARSAFADRFTELVGQPPLRYLTRLRINTAARRLRSSEDRLSAIAAGVGYESVSAFTRAFKRHLGRPPGEYREDRGSGGTV